MTNPEKKQPIGLLLCLLMVVIGFISPVYAEDKPPAVPVTEVQVETLEPPPGLAAPDKQQTAALERPQGQTTPNANTLVVVELFSSQACVFCPKADALLGELTKAENVLALSCHVDYFDVKTGSLSHPFCSTRQIAYESTLRAGPKYTPQIVINGRYDAVGYLKEDVLTAIRRARKAQVLIEPEVRQESDLQTFTLILPEMAAAQDSIYKIYILNFDSPHEIKVAEGGNKDKAMTYYNIVSNVGILGDWAGEAKSLKFNPKMSKKASGFAVLINDQKSGVIIGAAQYRRS